MRRKILVVDDSEILLTWLRTHLHAAGYEMLTVQNAREVGATVARERPDAIVLDMMMPNSECGEVVAAIRLRMAGRRVPVILYSGQPERALIAGLARYGAQGCVAKKRDPAELLATIADCIAQAAKPIEVTEAPEPVFKKPGAQCLFVDDDATVLRAYQRWFGNKIDADYVSSPQDALGRLNASHPPAFVVSDVVMPSMSGFDLYAKAVTLNDDWSERFVLVTGSASWTRFAGVHQLKAPVLPKPVSNEHLHSLITARR